jgi:hypothetical protein
MVNGKFIFIKHLPLTIIFRGLVKQIQKNMAQTNLLFYQEFKFFIVAIKYDVGHFWPQ